jgi:hypothetical protein
MAVVEVEPACVAFSHSLEKSFCEARRMTAFANSLNWASLSFFEAVQL